MKFSDSIKQATRQVMLEDDNVLLFGLGVPDPKGIFGTTLGLQHEFGSERVFDVPLSENALTGASIGLALGGYRPIFIHQRLDFFLLAMDQLVNGAAKWHMMFGGQKSVPITFRLIIGRGWGQGPTHSQALHAWFSHVPGLKVVMPSDPTDAAHLFVESVRDPNPVIYIEHRWLHNLEGSTPSTFDPLPIGKGRIVRTGSDITIVASSLMVIEAMHAIEQIEKQADVTCELIDLRSIKPLDINLIIKSVQKTGRLLVLDIGSEFGSIAGEIISQVAEKVGDQLISNPKRICNPNYATPTGFSLTENFYPGSEEICAGVAQLLGVQIDTCALRPQKDNKHDLPGDWFTGPF